MAQIREIKKRIKSVKSTQKVTHAMELVSAAKMRRAQDAALSGRPYTIALDEILKEAKAKAQHKFHSPLMRHNQSEKQLVILVTSDRGLAGGLNINLFREIAKTQNKNIKFITVGKKALNFIAKSGNDLAASFESEEKSPLDLARILSKMVIDSYIAKEVGAVSILFPDFETTVKQTPKFIQILPIAPTTEGTQEAIDDLLFEPSPDKIFAQILPHFVLTQIYQVLLESKASEHSARMVAMKNATDAAGDLVDDLTLTYNQARQEAITKELLDIITAQKAFE